MVYHTYIHDIAMHAYTSDQELMLQSEGVALQGIQSLAYRLPVLSIDCCVFREFLDCVAHSADCVDP